MRLTGVAGCSWSTEATRAVFGSRTAPPSGCNSPRMILNRVDLPTPLRPTNPTLEPGGTATLGYNNTLSNENLYFQFLGIRLITNATDVKYRFTKRLDAFAGYRYSNREIRSIEDSAGPGQVFQGLTGQQTNVLQAGVAGVNWILLKDLRLHVEGEIGRDDHAFAPNSLAHYHAIRARVRYAKRKYSISGGFQQNYNKNSIQVTTYSSRSRNYNGDVTWNAKSWLALDASYSNLHLDTIGGLQFFAGSPRASLVADQSSYYISNIHAANLGLRIPIRKRADLYAGYSLTRDAGDSRAAYILPRLAPGLADLYHAETFPLTYQTPLLRLSVQITPKLRYNIGYQYYGYHEDFGLLGQNQNYRAHTGYTSLLWSF